MNNHCFCPVYGYELSYDGRLFTYICRDKYRIYTSEGSVKYSDNYDENEEGYNNQQDYFDLLYIYYYELLFKSDLFNYIY